MDYYIILVLQFEMKLVNNREVASILLARKRSKLLNEYDNLKVKYFDMSLCKLRKEFAHLINTNEFDELFSKKVRWYEIELNPDDCLVNMCYDTLLNTKGLHNYDLPKIKSMLHQFPRQEIRLIEQIRQTLSPNPRVILTTTDWEQYNIYDGWHTSLAFYLENCKLPAFVGHSNSFSFHY